MKRSSLYLALLIISATFLSSCSFLQKGEFAQRKYYSFPRAKHSVNINTSITENKSPIKNETSVIENKEVISTVSIQKKKTVFVETSVEELLNYNEDNTKPVIEIKTTESPAVEFGKKEIKKQADKSFPFFPFSQDAGMMLIIAVIAAIFLPPLGIFIKENWRTTKWFWITLLMVLVGGGFLAVGNVGYRGIFGAIYILAIIIALMVIFDSL